MTQSMAQSDIDFRTARLLNLPRSLPRANSEQWTHRVQQEWISIVDPPCKIHHTITVCILQGGVRALQRRWRGHLARKGRVDDQVINVSD